MSKKLLIFLFPLVLSRISAAQGLEGELQFGYGTFAMKETKLFMDRVLIESPFPLEVVEDFPSFMTFSGSLSFPLNTSSRFGIMFGSTSTGSRAHYQDYSGEVGFDLLAKSILISLTGEKRLKSFFSEKVSLNLTGNMGFIFSSCDAKSYIKLLDQEEKDAQMLFSESFFMEPGLKLRYKLSKTFFTGPRISYLFDTRSKLHIPGDRQRFLMNYGSKPVKTDWSGLRAHMVFGIFL